MEYLLCSPIVWLGTVFWLAKPNYSILIFQGFCLWLCFRIYGLEQPAVLHRFQITLVCYSWADIWWSEWSSLLISIVFQHWGPWREKNTHKKINAGLSFAKINSHSPSHSTVFFRDCYKEVITYSGTPVVWPFTCGRQRLLSSLHSELFNGL